MNLNINELKKTMVDRVDAELWSSIDNVLTGEAFCLVMEREDDC